MKKWCFRLGVVAVLGGLGYWGWVVFFPSPEQVIRKRLTELARTASFSGNEGALVKLANARALTEFCTPDVEIVVDVPGRSVQTISGRDELLQAVAAAVAFGNGLHVEFFDILVSVAPDQNSAVAELTARANMPRDKEFYLQELKFVLKKVEGKWLISRAETVKVLSR